MKLPIEEEEEAAREQSEERDTSTKTKPILPVLLPRWAK